MHMKRNHLWIIIKNKTAMYINILTSTQTKQTKLNNAVNFFHQLLQLHTDC